LGLPIKKFPEKIAQKKRFKNKITMKKLLTVLLISTLGIVSTLKGQSVESVNPKDLSVVVVENKLLKIERDVENINLRLNNHKREYFGGVALWATGGVLTVLGSVVFIGSQYPRDWAGEILGMIGIGAGTVFTIGGGIKMIRSHNKL
jgi:hypothetical protein